MIMMMMKVAAAVVFVYIYIYIYIYIYVCVCVFIVHTPRLKYKKNTILRSTIFKIMFYFTALWIYRNLR
jgi:hypothetical protein